MSTIDIISPGNLFPAMANAQQSRPATNDAADTASDGKLREVCAEFESIFLHYMLSNMRQMGPKADLLDSGFASELYQDMLDEEFAKEAAKTNSFGLGELLYLQLSER